MGYFPQGVRGGQAWLSITLEQNVGTLSRFSAGISVSFPEDHKELILSLLWTQFLSSEISYNLKVAIIGHLHCTDFDRNDRPIFSL